MPRFPLTDPLHHPSTDAFILCTVPTVIAESILTVDLSLYGLDPSLLTNNFTVDGFATILHVEDSTGAIVINDAVATIPLATGELVITDGVTALATGQRFFVIVSKQRIIIEDGVLSG